VKKERLPENRRRERIMKPVSVIIPVYNEEKTLPRTVRSVLNQTLAPAEVILVDDGSSDKSGLICDDLAGKHACIKVIHMDDEGVSAARNRGLAMATSERVTFLDGDDAMDPHMLERLSTLMDSTGAAITGCGFRAVAIDKAAEPVSNGGEAGQTPPEILRGGQIVTRALLERDTRVWSKLFERSRLPAMQFMEGLTIGEDMLFVLSLLDDLTCYARTTEALYLYTINPAGLMERPFSPSYMDQIRCWELAEEQIAERFPNAAADTEAAGQLKAIQILSVLLAAQKIARLGISGRRRYRQEFRYCRERMGKYWDALPDKGKLETKDRLKAVLLMRAPTLFTLVVSLYSRLQGRRIT